MRNLPALVLALVAASAAAAPPAPSASADESVRAAVLAVLERQAAAWNEGDLVAFCSVYSEDATFLSPSGVTRTRQAVLDRYRARYPDAASRGTLTLEPIEVRVHRAGPAAIGAVSVAARWTIARTGEKSLTGLTLLVFRPASPTRWEIVQDASM